MTWPLPAAGWLLLIAALAAGTGIGWLGGWVLGLKSGNERGKFNAQLRYLPRIAALEHEHREFRLWRDRHRPPWAIEAPRRPAPPSRVPSLVTARDTAPVIVPLPEPTAAEQAEPGTFASLTDTGAMRAMAELTDEFIAEIEGGKDTVTDCTAPRHDEPEQATPSAYLCRPCQGALRGDLRRLPQLDRDLEDMLDTRRAGPGRGSGGDGLPWHEPAAECRSQIRHDARYWVTWIIDDRQPDAWPVRSVTAMCAWLHGWAGWIPYQPWAGDMAAALAADRGRATALLDPRPRTDIPVDRCPRCPDGMLRAVIPLTEGDRRPTLITCTDCGHEWDTTQWLGLGRAILARKAAA